jgi:hypothetical protein
MAVADLNFRFVIASLTYAMVLMGWGGATTLVGVA